jgi:hypothetical protein
VTTPKARLRETRRGLANRKQIAFTAAQRKDLASICATPGFLEGIAEAADAYRFAREYRDNTWTPAELLAHLESVDKTVAHLVDLILGNVPREVELPKAQAAFVAFHDAYAAEARQARRRFESAKRRGRNVDPELWLASRLKGVFRAFGLPIRAATYQRGAQLGILDAFHLVAAAIGAAAVDDATVAKYLRKV